MCKLISPRNSRFRGVLSEKSPGDSTSWRLSYGQKQIRLMSREVFWYIFDPGQGLPPIMAGLRILNDLSKNL